MPIPNPEKDETQPHFMDRCIWDETRSRKFDYPERL
jgi:hypothetical protein